MSDTSPNGPGPGPGPGHRRSSITQAALSNLFQRGPPTASTGPPFPGANGNADPQRRRLSITTIGLSGTSPSNNSASFMRRGSMSTNSNSDSIDENAIEDEDAVFGGPRTAPTTPFVRHMSFGGNSAMRNLRTGGSPGNGKSPKSPPPSSLGRNHAGHGDQWLPLMSQSYPHQRQVSISAAWPAVGRRSSLHGPPPSHPQASNVQHPRASSDNPPSRADQFGFNWSEQLRTRAESSVTGARPSFSFQGTGSHSPPRAMPNHDRSKSISDMPQPPAQAASVKPKQPERPKPDAFQERILKGDFYMD